MNDRWMIEWAHTASDNEKISLTLKKKCFSINKEIKYHNYYHNYVLWIHYDNATLEIKHLWRNLFYNFIPENKSNCELILASRKWPEHFLIDGWIYLGPNAAKFSAWHFSCFFAWNFKIFLLCWHLHNRWD